VGARKLIEVTIIVDKKKNVFVCKQDLFENNLINIMNRNDISNMQGDIKLKECMEIISIEGADRLYGIIKTGLLIQ
jgi:hypothetical protein